MSGVWNDRSEERDRALSRAALHHAALMVAEQAEILAAEMEAGRLQHRGGADALRLFAAILRVNVDAGGGT
jgi:hypothetical protein